MVVTTADNLRRTRESGFRLHGVRSKHRKKVERIKPGDRVLYYVQDRMGFAATATVTDGYRESHDRIWSDHRENEDFPHRFAVRLDSDLHGEGLIDAREIAPRMDFVRRWPPEQWSLAFLGEIHVISGADFTLIETEIERLSPRRSPAPEPAPVAGSTVAADPGGTPAGRATLTADEAVAGAPASDDAGPSEAPIEQ
jgi:hypothetical protein